MESIKITTFEGGMVPGLMEAKGNMFVVAQLDAANDGARGTCGIKVFGNPDRECRASIHLFTFNHGDTWVPMNSCSMLVRAGESFTPWVSQTCPTVRFTVMEIPF